MSIKHFIQTLKKYTFVSADHVTFSKIDHIIGAKQLSRNTGKLKRNNIFYMIIKK